MRQSTPVVVEFSSTNGLLLQGLLFGQFNDVPTVIHVHGSCGNFLSFSPIILEASILNANGINLLSINTSACDGIREGFRGTEFGYVGGAISDFDECVSDIAGAIEYAQRFSSKVILQGHSLGCDRVVHYQIATCDYYDTVLIAPCDSYALHQIFLGDETLEEQIARLKRSYSMERHCLLAPNEYGIRSKGEEYWIPITLRTFLSVAEGPPFRLFRLDKTIDYFIRSRAFVAIGKLDPLQTVEPAEMFRHLSNRFVAVERVLLTNSNHEMEPEARHLFEQLMTWIRIVQ